MTIKDIIDITLEEKNDEHTIDVERRNAIMEEAIRLINHPVNQMTDEGNTALDTVEQNVNTSEEIKISMRNLLREYGGLTGNQIRELKQILQIE